jgi:hypothetical protein
MMRLVLIVFLFMIHYAISHRQTRTINGCGAADSWVNVNWVLRGVGEGFRIACCNDHDVCYGMCDRS